MSPRPANADVRAALLESAARLLAEQGPAGLTTRRLAEQVGVSTMAVYTHFGGKDELLAAISVEGFLRLGRRLGRVRRTDDPVADLFELARAYRRNALANPDLYRVMFGAMPTSTMLRDEDVAMSLGTFETLVGAIERCMSAGRFSAGDPWLVAAQAWSAEHGVVMLELAGFFAERATATQCFADLMYALAVGLGDRPEAASRSFGRAPSGAR